MSDLASTFSFASAHQPQPQKGPSVVAHVVVVGFHAQLGNRIEFAYPRLRGDPILRSPRIWDTSDISADAASPTIVQRTTPTLRHKYDIPHAAPHPHPNSSSSSTGTSTTNPSSTTTEDQPLEQQQQTVPMSPVSDWGVLPEEWSFLPFMAMPDGVHDHSHDLVFFTLPPDVHCVACFRQADADAARTHSAATGRSYENSVAARGSVQKSIVLLCRRPLFGVLAERLIPAVRAYFEQADFADTNVLSSLFHSLNVSLSRPSLANSDTLFHGLDLRAIIRRLGPQVLAVLKLLLLERRVIIYSQPVSHASNAVTALASVFHGALDSIAPSLKPLDAQPSDEELGLPLSMFGPSDRIVLQPYAPLPLVSDLIPNNSPRGCLIATSRNVGLLLSNAASAAARKAAAARRDSNNLGIASPLDIIARIPRPSETTPLSLTNSASSQARTTSPSPHRTTARPPRPDPKLSSTASSNGNLVDTTPIRAATGSDTLPPAITTHPSKSPSPRRSRAGVPIVDALVNLSNGKISVSALLEPICRITRAERRFMRDLVVAASTSSGSTSSSGTTGPFVGSDDYIRARLREYLTGFLRSIATVDGVIGGPIGAETWSSELIATLPLVGFDHYNEQFVRTWLSTRNAAQWARRCDPKIAEIREVPAPELNESLAEDSLLPVDRVSAGLSGLRQNVAELGKFSSTVSATAAEGLSSIFKRIGQEFAKMDLGVEAATAVGGFGARPRGTAGTPRPEAQDSKPRTRTSRGTVTTSTTTGAEGTTGAAGDENALDTAHLGSNVDGGQAKSG